LQTFKERLTGLCYTLYARGLADNLAILTRCGEQSFLGYLLRSLLAYVYTCLTKDFSHPRYHCQCPGIQ